MGERRRSWWGWGWEDEAVSGRELEDLQGLLSAQFGRDLTLADPPRLGDLTVRPSRLEPPAAVAAWCSTSVVERAGHGRGKAYRDVMAGLAGDVAGLPDVVARPRSEAEVIATLDWAAESGAAAIPWGGGSSVVGGVNADRIPDRPVVTIDLTALDRVLEIDHESRLARIQGGALGPVLEDQLRPHGLTLRHFPQSFEHSTLGGWLATRSGGHFATVKTHIDDFCASMRAITPSGALESRRLPGSGAGPSPDRLMLGSEGTLGIITEAWMRVQPRPVFTASAAVHFADVDAGVAAVRELAQSGLDPSNCRLLDPGEAMLSAGATDGAAVLVVGFESATTPVDPWLEPALDICRGHGGTIPAPIRTRGPEPEGGDAGAPPMPAASARDSSARDGFAHGGSAQGGSARGGSAQGGSAQGGLARGGSAQGGPAQGASERGGATGADSAWRSTFLRAPYMRDAAARLGVITETFETACPWDRFDELRHAVCDRIGQVGREVCGAEPLVTWRFTHVYPDGPAPYFTVIVPGRRGSEISQWDEIKAGVSEALIDSGGTITHHHAVGRDHVGAYGRQQPELFARALAAVKRELDPDRVLNPGVLGL